ncbi:MULTISPECIES: FadR/GntR family transcriptional regulator [Larkinella]|uniref:FadR family transcriptional regulator n=2 Tax=Larkinella TaxID=332157 RepID=A0A5N1JGX4_9BACT|nr:MULTISPECIES: GntR family transcriptional regulator [Larkinella]KAA9354688.1 FadR family transcriptional regulator [Larkinella humicola]RCR71366.1 FadR family transcriptional regulator [Larkinella punicea]
MEKVESSLGMLPIISTSMADQVELRLREYIANKAFKPGDAIPKEIELAEALGVSRNVVREALSRFRMLGIIETKKRRGMILAQPDILSGLERMMQPHMLGADTRKQIFEFRLVLEVGQAALLFARKTEEGIQKLQEVVKRESQVSSIPEKVECEIAFHSTLYEMAGNETIKRFQTMLMPVFEYVVEYETSHQFHAVGSVTHQDLINILKTGTPAEFASGMLKHLEPHFVLLS